MALSVGLQLPMPLLTMYIIDHLLTPQKVHLINLICLGLLLILLVRAVTAFFQRYFLSTFRLRVVFDIKKQIYEHIQKLSLSFFHKKQTGYLISRISGDVEGLQGLFAETVLSLIRDVLTLLVGIIAMFWINWKLALISLGILPFFLLSLTIFNKKIRELSKQDREAYANVSKNLQESLSGIAVVKAFVAEKYDLIKMLKTLKQAIRLDFRSDIWGTGASISATVISSMGPLILIWLGCLEIVRGHLTLGGLIAFNSFLAYLFGPIERLSNLNITVQSSLASAERVFEILDIEPERKETTKTGQVSRFKEGKVSFENVTFSYNGNAPVLHNITFEALPNTVTALVGRSGAGKSSLVNLIPRFYEPQQGNIRINGIDIKNIPLKDLRKHIGLVTQETFLFSFSIKENIRLGNQKAKQEDIVEAAKRAYAHNFITQLPEGYETKIGERGAFLSGGERQRIAIARVILKNPKIIILDEATSSLDSESEKYVQQALEELFKDRTTFVVAHRLSTILKADKILVINEGKIVELGKHEELYSKGQVYRKLYDEQFKDMESFSEVNC